MGKNLDAIKDMVKGGIKEFKEGTKTMFKEFFNKETNKKQRANMWTFIRLLIPFITIISSVCAIVASSTILFTVTGLIAGFGAVTDYFDGKSARKHGSTSKYGKLLDQVSDKIFAGIIGINLLFLNTNYLFILFGELLIAAVNVGYKIKEPDLDITSTKLGKIKEWPLFFTLALGFLSPINSTLLTISNVSIAITSLIQVLTSISYVDSNSKEVKKLRRTKKLEDLNKFIEEEEEKERELVLSKDKEKTLLEKYRELSNTLKEVIELKNEDTIMDIKDNPKEKKL